MILFIDITENEKIHLALLGMKTIKHFFFSAHSHHFEALLKSIDSIFKKKGVGLRDLSGIAVVKGPGKFSALRAAISCSNTLAWALHIPILGVTKREEKEKNFYETLLKKMKKVKKGKWISPQYGKEPHITYVKKN